MGEKYLITGGAGNLGSAILKELAGSGAAVRALVLPGDRTAAHMLPDIEKIDGDVRSRDDLERFFDLPDIRERVVIHAAGIVTIYPGFNRTVYDVNVGGTRNMASMCLEKRVKKLIYVSSVHAIPTKQGDAVMEEMHGFDPDRVRGFYAKTKAEASRAVEEAGRAGLDENIVFPSGLCGPGDYARGHITQLLIDCAREKLPAGIDGGYDFADVRDVAAGIVAAARQAPAGENYILNNRYISIREILNYVHELTGAKLVKRIFPVAFARAVAPFLELYYKIMKRPPLFTGESLNVLTENTRFSGEKAKKELGYVTRPFRETVADTLDWLKKEQMI